MKTRLKLNKKSKNLLLEKRQEEIKEAGRVLTLTKTALIMLGDLAAVTVTSFWPHPYYHTFCNHRERSFKTTLSRMKRDGLIKRDPNAEKFFVLTKRGEREREKALRHINIESAKREKWDGKWRVLFFDVPEKQRKLRNFLRAELIDYGFEPLQKSVFVSPFRIAEDIIEVLEYRGIERWIKFMVTDTIFGDEELRIKFKLEGRE